MLNLVLQNLEMTRLGWTKYR